MTEPASPTSLAAQKRELRSWARRLLRPSPVELERRARLLVERLLALPELTGPGTLSLYGAVGHEVPLDSADLELRARGWKLVAPRVGMGGLALHCVAGCSALEPGALGVPEAPGSGPLVQPEDVDVFLVPGVLFDRRGHRLGRGAGHYDRLLGRARRDASIVGITLSERLVEVVPAGFDDVSMRLLATDLEVARTLG